MWPTRLRRISTAPRRGPGRSHLVDHDAELGTRSGRTISPETMPRAVADRVGRRAGCARSCRARRAAASPNWRMRRVRLIRSSRTGSRMPALIAGKAAATADPGARAQAGASLRPAATASMARNNCRADIEAAAFQQQPIQQAARPAAAGRTDPTEVRFSVASTWSASAPLGPKLQPAVDPLLRALVAEQAPTAPAPRSPEPPGRRRRRAGVPMTWPYSRTRLGWNRSAGSAMPRLSSSAMNFGRMPVASK